MGFYLASGVYPEELDLSGRVQAIATSIGAAVIQSKKGSLTPQFFVDGQRFLEMFGAPDASWGYGHHSIYKFLEYGPCWVKRVVKGAGPGGARHAGLVMHNDRFGSQASQTYFWPFNSGRFEDYKGSSQKIITLVFSAALIASNSTNIVIGDDPDTGEGNEITSTTVFATNSDATMQAIATDLQTKINTQWGADADRNIGSVTVIKQGASSSDDRIIRIVCPEDRDLYVKTSAITLGSTQATISVQENPWLCEFYAENPGKWANDIGIKIVNIDQGVRQRRKLTFSGAIGSGQTFNAAIDINGVRIQVDSVSYATSNDATLEAIRVAILAAFNANGYAGLADAYVVQAGANDREIEIISPIDGPDSFTITPEVTGSGSPPTILVTETLAGVAKDDTFEIQVFERTNTTNPIKKHVVSFNRQTDGFAQQQFIEDVINLSSDKSDVIRVRYNALNGSGQLKNLPVLPQDAVIQWLGGGVDGDRPTANAIASAWDVFNDRGTHALRILINCGETSQIVQSKMKDICMKRRDCFAILDMPSHLQNTIDAINYRMVTLNINSSFAAIYTPDLQIIDEFTNETIFVPPSGYVAAQFAENDDVAAEWFAPAGLRRGLISGIQALRVEYRQADLEQLQPKQINAIIKKPGKGYPIWGAETLQSRASALSNINVRRLLITIEVSLVDALDYSIYEPNDPETRFEVVQMCENFLQPIKEGRGLKGYKIISDESNTKHFHEDMGQLNVDLILKPVIPVKFIRLRSVITRVGAAFEEIAQLLESGGTVSA